MANTLKTYPIRPLGGMGGNAVPMMSFPLEPSVTIQNGDVIVVDSASSNDVESDNAAATGIIGVAQMRDSALVTANSTIDKDGTTVPSNDTVDAITVALAVPGSFWEGSLIQTGPADHTGVYADDILVSFGLLESDATGGLHGCLNFSDTAGPTCHVLRYQSPQTDQSDGSVKTGRSAGVGVDNPRVVFNWVTSTTVF